MASITTPLRVVAADPDAATRAGIRAALASEGIRVCGEAASADALVRMVAMRRPSVSLVGGGLLGGTLQAAREVVRTAPWTAVVLMAPSDEAELIDALRDGIAGFVPPDVEPARLAPALRAAAAGEVLIPRRLVARLVQELRSDDRRRIAVAPGDGQPGYVTNREWRVIEMLARGRSTAQVASRLGLSPVTVRRHVSSAMGKLGVTDRESVFRLAVGRR